MTKPRFTPEQHAEMGRKLAGIRDELIHLSVDLGEAYPKTGREGAPARDLGKAADLVDDARMRLDGIYLSEAPDSDEDTYNPPQEHRASVR